MSFLCQVESNYIKLLASHKCLERVVEIEICCGRVSDEGELLRERAVYYYCELLKENCFSELLRMSCPWSIVEGELCLESSWRERERDRRLLLFDSGY